MLNSKKIILSIGLSSFYLIFTQRLVPYVFFLLVTSALLPNYCKKYPPFESVFSIGNILTPVISGGFSTGLIFGLFKDRSNKSDNRNDLIISCVILIFILNYYFFIKIFGDLIFLMEIAICYMTAKTCSGMLRCR